MDSQSERLLQPALEECTIIVEELKGLANEFCNKSRPENKALRSLNALRFVKKGDKLERLKNRLQQAQVTLILAQQVSSRYFFLFGSIKILTLAILFNSRLTWETLRQLQVIQHDFHQSILVQAERQFANSLQTTRSMQEQFLETQERSNIALYKSIAHLQHQKSHMSMIQGPETQNYLAEVSAEARQDHPFICHRPNALPGTAQDIPGVVAQSPVVEYSKAEVDEQISHVEKIPFNQTSLDCSVRTRDSVKEMTTYMVLGSIYSSLKRVRVTKKTPRANNSRKPRDDLELFSSILFIPSWWLFGMLYAIRAQMLHSRHRGWQIMLSVQKLSFEDPSWLAGGRD